MGVPMWSSQVALVSHSLYPHFMWLPSATQIKKLAGNEPFMQLLVMRRTVSYYVFSCWLLAWAGPFILRARCWSKAMHCTVIGAVHATWLATLRLV